jgi:hypothetical protein
MRKQSCLYLGVALYVAVFCSPCLAGDTASVQDQYVRSTYWLQDRFFGTYLTNGSHRFNVANPDSLGRILLDASPDSKRLLRRARVFSAVGSVLAVVGCLGVFEAPMLAMRRPAAGYMPGVLFVGGAAMLGAAIPFEYGAANAGYKFVWTFNRDVIARK